jgi:hypothetical protein
MRSSPKSKGPSARKGLPRQSKARQGGLGIGDVYQLGVGLLVDQHLGALGTADALHCIEELPLGARHAAIGLLRQGRAETGPEHHKHDLTVGGLDQPGLKGAVRGEGLLLPKDRLDFEIRQELLSEPRDDVLHDRPLMVDVGGGGDEDADLVVGHGSFTKLAEAVREAL